MLYLLVMDAFTRILKTRPGTFTTFNASGPVENGFSPLFRTGTAPTVKLGPMVPGGLTYNAQMNGNTLTYQGNLFSAPEKGGSCSVEMIVKSSGEPSQLIDFPGVLSVETVEGEAIPEGPQGRENLFENPSLMQSSGEVEVFRNWCTGTTNSTDRWRSNITGAVIDLNGSAIRATNTQAGLGFLYWGQLEDTQYAQASPGEVWTLSADIMFNASGTRKICINALDNSGAQIDSESITVTFSGGVKQSVNFTRSETPAGTAYVGIAIAFGFSTIPDNWIEVDRVMLQKNSRAAAYFNGFENPYSSMFSASWVGDPGQSASILTGSLTNGVDATGSPPSFSAAGLGTVRLFSGVFASGSSPRAVLTTQGTPAEGGKFYSAKFELLSEVTGSVSARVNAYDGENDLGTVAELANPVSVGTGVKEVVIPATTQTPSTTTSLRVFVSLAGVPAGSDFYAVSVKNMIIEGVSNVGGTPGPYFGDNIAPAGYVSIKLGREGNEHYALYESSTTVSKYMISATGPSGESSSFISMPPVPSLDHVVVNINGGSANLIVNGVSTTVGIPPDAPGADSMVVKGGAGMELWGVVVRPNPVQMEYCVEMYDLISSFPAPSEADQKFDGATIAFGFDDLEYASKIDLQDVEFDNPLYEPVMYNGYDGDAELPSDWIYETLPTPASENINHVVVNSNRVSASVVTQDGEVLATHGRYGSREIIPIDSSGLVIGSQIKVSPENGRPLKMSMLLSDGQPTLISSSLPDQTAHLLDYSSLVGEFRMFGGGLKGQAVVHEDSEADAPEDFPFAYGFWAYLKSPTDIAIGNAFSLSYSSGISFTGVSSLVLDGASYTSGNVAPGWHHVAFTPSSQENAPITIGDAGSDIIVYCFTKYYRTSPASYLSQIYNSYVDPGTVRNSDTSTIAISDSSVRAYSHEWSITAVD